MTRRCSDLRALVIAGVVLSSVGARTSRAQGSSVPLVVRVHVADSSGAPAAGADVSIMRGLSEVLGHGLTDARGDRLLTVVRSGRDYEVIVRKIGFQRVSRFFPDSSRTPSFSIVLARSVHALDTIKVAEQEDVRRKSYFIDADAIEHSPRLVMDALDVVTKLRPDMIWGRAGIPDGIDQHVTSTRPLANGRAIAGGAVTIRNVGAVIGNALKFGYCPPVQSIWVNGERIHDVAAYNAVASKRLTGQGVFIASQLATILASIRPEHIAEMEYHPCSDAGDKPLSTNAIMIQLKDGIGFDPGNGSYVLSQGVPAGPSRVRTELAFPRVLGVFDDETGNALVDAEVVDVSTGTVARTTNTGTVTLSFVPPGAAQLRIEHAGFVSQVIPVSLSPTDTTPVTIILVRAKSAPAPLFENHRTDRLH